MYKLVIADEEGSTTVVPLVREEISVGRKEGNTIRLTERNVSRQHAIFRKQEGAYSVEDLDSYNGVRVNGAKIEHETLLKVGDQVGVGDYLLALQQAATEAAVATGDGPHRAPGEAASSPGPPPGMTLGQPARLIMLSPPAAGAEFSLASPLVAFGRGEDQDGWINHRSMSREHAEVRRTEQGYRVHDLSSANGVRVNGSSVAEAGLSSGDVVEFGRVRFRFIGAGEDYTFDADRTMQMAAYQLPTRGGRAPLMAALGILVAAGAIAMVILAGGDDSEPVRLAVAPQSPTVEPTPAAPMEPPPVAAEAVESANAAQAAEAVAACRESLRALEAGAAVAHADRALELSTGLASAVQCRGDALVLVEQEERFTSGQGALAAGDAAGAMAAFALLPEGSPYRSRPELATAANQHRDGELEEGRAAVADGRWDEAERLASSVLDDGATGGQARGARSLRDQAVAGRTQERERAAAVAAAAAVMPRTNANARSRPTGADRPSRPTGMVVDMRRPVAAVTPMVAVPPAMVEMAAAPAMMALTLSARCGGGLGRAIIPCICRLAANGDQQARNYVQAAQRRTPTICGR